MDKNFRVESKDKEVAKFEYSRFDYYDTKREAIADAKKRLKEAIKKIKDQTSGFFAIQVVDEGKKKAVFEDSFEKESKLVVGSKRVIKIAHKLIQSASQEEMMEFNNGLSKELKKLKKNLGAKRIQQNYRGTGKQAHRRQFYIHFAEPAVIDVFLENDEIKLGGVVWINSKGERLKPVPSKVKYSNTPAETYKEVEKVLKEWLGKE